MTEMSLLDVYSAAKDREVMTTWMTYHAVRLGVSVEDDGAVFVWPVDDTGNVAMFDPVDMSAGDFLDAVANFAVEA